MTTKLGKIEDYFSDGSPIVKDEGKIITLDKGVIGDTVEYTYSGEKRINQGKLLEIMEESPYRIDAGDSIKLRDAGFPFVELSYERELEWKRMKLENALRRIGGIEVHVKNCVGSPDILKYRNNVQIQFSQGTAGFYKRGTNELITPSILCFADDRIERIYAKICGKKYENVNLLGLRAGEEGVMAIVVSSAEKAGEIFEDLKRAGAVSIYLNTKEKDRRHYSEKMIHIYGEEYLSVNILKKRFKMYPGAFFQVNGKQAEHLYKMAVNALDLSKNDTLVELYAGMSTMGIIAAEKARKVISVELSADAVRSARIAAEENGVENIEFHCARAEEFAEKFKGTRDLKLLVDPPRAGLDKKIYGSVKRLRPSEIVYVSCDTASLARDLKELCKVGYELKTAEAIDLFPRTSSVEAVCKLCKTD